MRTRKRRSNPETDKLRPSGFRRNLNGELVPSGPGAFRKRKSRPKAKTRGEKKAEKLRLLLKAYHNENLLNEELVADRKGET